MHPLAKIKTDLGSTFAITFFGDFRHVPADNFGDLQNFCGKFRRLS
jgi:hypothetical protein